MLGMFISGEIIFRFSEIIFSNFQENFQVFDFAKKSVFVFRKIFRIRFFKCSILRKKKFCFLKIFVLSLPENFLFSAFFLYHVKHWKGWLNQYACNGVNCKDFTINKTWLDNGDNIIKYILKLCFFNAVKGEKILTIYVFQYLYY